MSGCRLLPIVLVSLAALVQGAGTAEVESAGKAIQEYLVVGTVVWANAASASIAIRGTSLIGRLHLDVKSYHVKQPGALANLHPGDRITAAFSEKDRMLHRLRRIVPRDPH
jgi:hypothetical protein